MKNICQAQVWMAVTGFLVTWQATGFDLDYRTVLSSVVSSLLAGKGMGKKSGSVK